MILFSISAIKVHQQAHETRNLTMRNAFHEVVRIAGVRGKRPYTKLNIKSGN